MPRLLLFSAGILGLVLAPTTRAQTVPPCGSGASIDVWIQNESGQSPITVDIDGAIDPAAVTCTGGQALAPSYAATMVCSGMGLVRCTDQGGAPASIGGLRPGAWVHRLRVTVAAAPGEAANDAQRQARRGIVVAPSSTSSARLAANPVVWSVYGFTRAVTTASAADLRAALVAAQTWTAAHPARRALVTLRPPGPITLDAQRCTPDPRCDSSLTAPKAGLCLEGDRVVLDGRGDDGRGAAELTVGTLVQPVVRIYGDDLELRGLKLVGTRGNTDTQADTVGFMSTAHRSALVESTVLGPSMGDGVGACGGGSDADANMIVDSLIRNAQDKGVKVTTGGVQLVSGSCIADNANGGVQATRGGRALVRENVVQHNVPSGAENGISASDGEGVVSSVTTRGNIVRFSGERGLSVADDAVGEFHDDYVARNQYSGALVETTRLGASPRASFNGVALVCNKVRFVSANCTKDCTGDGDCGSGATCVDQKCTPAKACIDDSDCRKDERCSNASPVGVGLGIQFANPGTDSPCVCSTPPCPCIPPAVTLGDGAAAGAELAMIGNRRAPRGANLQVTVPGATLAAGGTQWEGCGTSECGDASEATVRETNVGNLVGAAVSLLPIVASSARAPRLTQVSPPRPRAGDIVRVYGTGFDAINGNTLSPDCGNAPARDADFCDPSEPDLAQINRSTNGNRLRLSMGGQSRLLDLVAVTPTMLAFRMPVDCFAPATIELRRGSRTTGLPACDAAGCSGQPAGVTCADEGNACTTDVCDGAGTCVHQALPRGTECRPAAGPCDVTEVCDGTGSQCPPDGKRAADDVCRAATGTCDHPETCDGIGDQCPDDRFEDATHVCRPPAGACDVAETCDGLSVACPPDLVRPAGDVCRASQDQCDPAETCDGAEVTCPADTQASGFDAIGCRLNTLDGIANQGCRETRPIVVALTKATSTLQRAQQACAAGRVRPARRMLRRRVSHVLRRLDKLVSADPCLRGAGGRLTVTAAREQVPHLVELLPTLCR